MQMKSVLLAATWRRGRQNYHVSPSVAHVRRYSPNAYGRGANCPQGLTCVRPNSREIPAQIWAGVWARTFDGKLRLVDEREVHFFASGWGANAINNRARHSFTQQVLEPQSWWQSPYRYRCLLRVPSPTRLAHTGPSDPNAEARAFLSTSH
jgi:hypothetical protein